LTSLVKNGATRQPGDGTTLADSRSSCRSRDYV
jgi:hypothetical protein